MKVKAGATPAEVGSARSPERRGAPPARLCRPVGEVEQERARWYPKDGELCPGRAKPEETLVEARSGPDVQIGRPTWKPGSLAWSRAWNASAQWATFGKQNWRCGMNRTPG
ncbi:hypothetical protein KOW79_011899 [Hemibagrus wyckioides]|uniref:Uncharacterized protein n=1 Tax=Hemibagrus wyckioides TaxID=337641 RepID=A0A9D3SLI8_9TELE|nr:hypothetical protein KOW79_011899 [Hemibagrus wyckioides]